MGSVSPGWIRRIAGPLVEAEGLGAVAMSDVVSLGAARLPGEVVAIRDGVVTVQAYEYTGGLTPGDSVLSRGKPLMARLGPGLLGNVFDGLLRPLSMASPFLTPGAVESGAARTWRFEPRVAAGDQVSAGDELGVVRGGGPPEYRILVPPDVAGAVDDLAVGEQPQDAVVARVDGKPVGLWTDWPVRRPRPYRARRAEIGPLHTGQRVLDLLFPVAQGSTAAVPGGFGTGKTVLLQQVAKWCDADVIVYVGCGERGNEMAEVVAELFALADPRTGGRLADRTVVIANTSNMPMMAREASIYTGVTVAEHFRDMGHHAVVIADSTSRWAEALREFASRTGALPAEEGYPADLASALAAFYERAGSVEALGGTTGSVTIIGAVSPPGGDMAEPVTAHTERFVRCRWALDRDLAYARHYPAVSWSDSFSRDADLLARHHVRAGDPEWPRRRARVLGVLAESDRLSEFAELVGVGALPGRERIVLLSRRLIRESVLQQNALSTMDSFCGGDKAVALVESVLAITTECQELVDAGVSVEVIEEFDFAPLVRVREETAPHDADGVRRRCGAVLSALRELQP
ncbi:V/A-type H+-transporting ATPase subunit A [Saccharopolyspora shandongensis]|uniref:V/A-type H+-transporting ATPase subunit A n=1 Tax=Saccharopolyspora shandongensis TaxID=418495 RepID=A0A1H3QX35_9PSEU|nr:V-type ATP synthase subunit A [Saccharopolyspora shandongensis]SDZ17926.1 V/A-type H+-transporting ATPase subunit A [Saccharopolyspora shandongensis]